MKKVWLLAAAMFVYAEASYALFNLQLSYSHRWHKEGEQDTKAHGITVAGNVNPLPLIPAALGVSYAMFFYGEEENQPGVAPLDTEEKKSAQGMELGIEAIGWLPMVPIVNPYIRLHYTVWGYKKIREEKDKISGLIMGAGVSYPVIPLISVFLEGSYGIRSLKPEIGDEKDFNSYAVSIGVEGGI